MFDFFQVIMLIFFLGHRQIVYGFDTAIQRTINEAHVEVESSENGTGLVKLMGRVGGKNHPFTTSW